MNSSRIATERSSSSRFARSRQTSARMFDILEPTADSCDQLPRRERLDEIVIRSALDTHDGRVVARARAEQDDRNRPRAGIGAQLADELEAIHHGHHHVGDDEIGRSAACLLEGIESVRRGLDVAEHAPEQAGDIRAQVSVVVDEQDPRRAHADR